MKLPLYIDINKSLTRSRFELKSGESSSWFEILMWLRSKSAHYDIMRYLKDNYDIFMNTLLWYFLALLSLNLCIHWKELKRDLFEDFWSISFVFWADHFFLLHHSHFDCYSVLLLHLYYLLIRELINMNFIHWFSYTIFSHNFLFQNMFHFILYLSQLTNINWMAKLMRVIYTSFWNFVVYQISSAVRILNLTLLLKAGRQMRLGVFFITWYWLDQCIFLFFPILTFVF